MIHPLSKGDKILVRFVGRRFEFWNGCGFTHHRANAVRYCYSESMEVKRKMNDSGDFPFIVSVVDFLKRLNPHEG
jgi:hypothetical protein